MSFGRTLAALGAGKEDAKPPIISFQQELKATEVGTVPYREKNRIIATQVIHSHLNITAAPSSHVGDALTSGHSS